MNQNLVDWRAKAEALGPAQRRRYPHEMRQQAVALVTRAVASGMTKGAACAGLGIPVPTLERWRRATPAFRKVRVVDDVGSVEVRVGPLQARVSIEDFARLVRLLA